MTPLETAVPELAAHRATATRLRPTRGTPGVRDSSIGGPLLWPASEPWPHCHESHDDWAENVIGWQHGVWTLEQVATMRELSAGRVDDLPPADRARYDAAEAGVPFLVLTGGPVPLLSVAQVRRADVPDFVGPDDADLMQVLWCPVDHPDLWCPRVAVRWRREDEVGEILAAPPRPVVGTEDYVPWACVLAPERVTEYEYAELLPAEVREKLDAWGGVYDPIAPGWKVGGFARWNLTGPLEQACECGAGLRLVMSVQGGGERHGSREAWDPTEVSIGRGHALWIWCCSRDFGHPVRTTMQ
ncbi:hypothetical protein Afil01_55050 [Actinorhabdospora filicis]|uniref:DUF1963 domain-containing protein n=1 Tax=Actinorhabdospora filicis TaxID=1785913 RepID=A0A9W6SRE1_9ACTN|nr:hypothetical protein [Actinorhabdospora filicis]GLZ80698.1 hypothetical protein Afil01_55050 [Actinorhabdospora filicis]